MNPRRKIQNKKSSKKSNQKTHAKTNAVSNRMQIEREDDQFHEKMHSQPWYLELKKKDSEREVKNENLNKPDEQSEIMNEEILRSARKIMRELNEKENQYECKLCKLRFENKNNLRDHICNTQKKIESSTDQKEKTDIAKIEALIMDGKEHREDIAKIVSGCPELAENVAKLPRDHPEIVELNRDCLLYTSDAADE